MRIIGGEYGGRRLAGLGGARLRPTADRVREALFSILGDRIVDRPFFDLAAGVGAVGLEALSRGARPVWLVERDPAALRVIRRNLALLGLAARSAVEVVVVAADVEDWLKRQVHGGAPRPVGTVYVDPPWGERRLPRWITALVRSGLLDEESLVVVEHRTGEAPELLRLAVVWRRRYGDSSLTAATLAAPPETAANDRGRM